MAGATGTVAAKKPKKRKRAKAAARRKTTRTSEAEQNGYLDPRITKALSHWLRVNILAVASWRIISPSEFARETGTPLKKVSYHFRRLVHYEALELVDTKVVGSTVKRFYRGTRPSTTSWRSRRWSTSSPGLESSSWPWIKRPGHG